MDTVQWIESAKKAEADVDYARCVSGANYLETIPPGYTGKGIRGHVMEGIYRDHPDFAATPNRHMPIAVDDASPDGHGQSTYGEFLEVDKRCPKPAAFFRTLKVITRTIRRSSAVLLDLAPAPVWLRN